MTKSEAIQEAKKRQKKMGLTWTIKLIKKGFWIDIYRRLIGRQIYQVVTAFKVTNAHVKKIQAEYRNLGISKQHIDELNSELKLYRERQESKTLNYD